MLAGSPDRDDDAGTVASVHELASYLRRHTHELCLAEFVFLALHCDGESTAHHEVDLFLLAVTMDSSALPGLESHLVQSEARHAERTPEREKSLITRPVDIGGGRIWFQRSVPGSLEAYRVGGSSRALDSHLDLPGPRLQRPSSKRV